MDILGIVLIGIGAILNNYADVWLKSAMVEKDGLPLYKIIRKSFHIFNWKSINIKQHKIPILLKIISLILFFTGLLIIIFNHI